MRYFINAVYKSHCKLSISNEILANIQRWLIREENLITVSFSGSRLSHSRFSSIALRGIYSAVPCLQGERVKAVCGFERWALNDICYIWNSSEGSRTESKQEGVRGGGRVGRDGFEGI